MSFSHALVLIIIKKILVVKNVRDKKKITCLYFYTVTSSINLLSFFFQNDQSMQDMQIMGGDDLSKLTGKVC